MKSAKVGFNIIDKSFFFARQDGKPSAVVIKSNKGEVGKSILMTDVKQFLREMGDPIGLDMGWASAYSYLDTVGSIYVSRAIGANAKYAYSLVYNKEYGDTKDLIGEEGVGGLDSIENQNQLFTDGGGVQKYALAVFNSTLGDTSVEIVLDSVIGYLEEEKVFKLSVYDAKTKQQLETFVVSMIDTQDVQGNSLNAEEVINEQSSLIRVMINPNGNTFPSLSEVSKWQRHPDPIFKQDDTKNFTYDFTMSDGVNKKVKLPNVDNLAVGDKLVFSDTNYTALAVNMSDFSYSEVYTIVDVNTASKEIKLNKPYMFIPDNNTVRVYLRDTTYNGTLEGLPSDATIHDGEVIYEVHEIKGAILGVKNKDNYAINNKFGKLISSATVKTTSGDNGDAVTEGDMIQALEPFKNRITTPISVLMDGGYTSKNFQRKMVEVVQKQRFAQAYINIDMQVGKSADPLNKSLQYSRELGIDNYRVSLFSGVVTDYNEYLKKQIVLPASTIATVLQTITTETQGSWMPSAGLNRGVFTSAGDYYDFNEEERDILVNNRINPIYHDEATGVYAIWGNETTQRRPSYLQQRSVVSLVLDIGNLVNANMPYSLFELNDETTWDTVEGSIRSVLRDDYKSKGAIYDYIVDVKDVITDTDIDNRTMPVFIGIKPVGSINYIPIELAVFSKSVELKIK